MPRQKTKPGSLGLRLLRFGQARVQRYVPETNFTDEYDDLPFAWPENHVETPVRPTYDAAPPEISRAEMPPTRTSPPQARPQPVPPMPPQEKKGGIPSDLLALLDSYKDDLAQQREADAQATNAPKTEVVRRMPERPRPAIIEEVHAPRTSAQESTPEPDMESWLNEDELDEDTAFMDVPAANAVIEPSARSLPPVRASRPENSVYRSAMDDGIVDYPLESDSLAEANGTDAQDTQIDFEPPQAPTTPEIVQRKADVAPQTPIADRPTKTVPRVTDSAPRENTPQTLIHDNLPTEIPEIIQSRRETPIQRMPESESSFNEVPLDEALRPGWREEAPPKPRTQAQNELRRAIIYEPPSQKHRAPVDADGYPLPLLDDEMDSQTEQVDYEQVENYIRNETPPAAPTHPETIQRREDKPETIQRSEDKPQKSVPRKKQSKAPVENRAPVQDDSAVSDLLTATEWSEPSVVRRAESHETAAPVQHHAADNGEPSGQAAQEVDLYDALLNAGMIAPSVSEMREIDPDIWPKRDESAPTRIDYSDGEDIPTSIPEVGSVEASLLQLLDLPPDTPVTGLAPASQRSLAHGPEITPAVPTPRVQTKRAAPSKTDTQDIPTVQSRVENVVSREESAPTTTTTTSDTSAHTTEGGEDGEKKDGPNVDKLAREVYRLLRNRLRVEQERRSDK